MSSIERDLDVTKEIVAVDRVLNLTELRSTVYRRYHDFKVVVFLVCVNTVVYKDKVVDS